MHHDWSPAGRHFRTVPDPHLASNTVVEGFFHLHTPAVSNIAPSQQWSAEQLAQIAHEQHLDFVLVLGDFIYADSPPYAGNCVQIFGESTKNLTQAQDGKRTIRIYDDCEIYNGWAGQDTNTDPTFQPANKAYKHYLGNANYDGPGKGKNYCWFWYGDFLYGTVVVIDIQTKV
ncbi:uncharacterized protein MELLADRAFT_84542 [Melampsora larici-populina 98AG31]|uniref:Calcineurin-like phosphoesterase domain-containing protein n=1 Tax=Melampsora larici-populina (strain 98AG31 / pathotype 3-4-7) TaxID=747676 RepID=F4SCD9_MELLP|nr:uncharacterized protein MELLADRAFT_84542 [Melampsora larici-populina 98AG31]EGF97678.1 hypothetical protein MELLADRAFT_84542 [Melampsora larici-populina 98AG31]